MTEHATGAMRSYWDERARLEAAWYVDTTLDYDNADMDQFFQHTPRASPVVRFDCASTEERSRSLESARG